MIRFTATLLKFKEKGEKTGWTYIEIPSKLAEQLNPGVKKSFRVKGKLDAYAFDALALLPMGEGNFILPLKTDIRRSIKKNAGATVQVQMALQPKGYELDKEFVECLKDEPKALEFFDTLTGSHRIYFSKWIGSAKTAETKAKRIALAVNALAKKWGYPEMIRANMKDK